MKILRSSVMLALAAIGVACEMVPEQSYTPEPEPLKEDVPPIRNCAIKLLVTSNLTYSAQDERAARRSVPDQVVDLLNDRGASDGNRFSIASGEAHNFTLHYTVNNDGNDRYTGHVDMSGWGWGHIATLYSGEYSYSNAPQMIDALTEKVYGYIHSGWHDARRRQ